MYKNVSSQQMAVYAYDTSADAPKTGDAANITAVVSLDGAAEAALTDTNPAEIGGGVYLFDFTQAETNANLIILRASSSTTNVQIEPVIMDTGRLNEPGNALGVVRGGDTDSLEDVQAIVMNALLADYTTTGSFSAVLAYVNTIIERINGMLEADGAGGYQYTILSLENAPGGGGSTDVNVVNVGGVAVTGPDDLKADLTTVESNQTTINNNVLAVGVDVGNLNDITVAEIIAGITDGTYDLQEILRAIAGSVAGTTDRDGLTQKSLDGTKDRAIWNIVDGERVLVSRDLT